MDWKTDKQGRKYRQLAPGCIEHMPTIRIDGIEIENTPEAREAFQEAHKAAMERQQAAEKQQLALESTGKICPFGTSVSAHRECKTICGLYRATGCAHKRQEAAQDTNGKPCPYMRKCTPQCALYDNGCTL